MSAPASTVARDLPTCPACGFEDDETWDWFDGDSDVTQIECDACGVLLKITRCVSYSYSAELVSPPEVS